MWFVLVLLRAVYNDLFVVWPRFRATTLEQLVLLLAFLGSKSVPYPALTQPTCVLWPLCGSVGNVVTFWLSTWIAGSILSPERKRLGVEYSAQT